MIISEYESPLGKITMAAENDALIGLWIEGQKYFLSRYGTDFARDDDAEIIRQTKGWLDRYFAGEKPVPEELKLAPSGSPFAQLIWKYLCEIPYSQTTTYGMLAVKAAAELGRERMSAQAVGGAVGHNPISIIIPCHRVLGAGGAMTGYAGGIEKKYWLLVHEKALSDKNERV